LRSLWPIGEAAQADYEALRSAVVAGVPLIGSRAARFERGGLAALIARPRAAAEFAAILVGACRPPWTPYEDPRTEALSDSYGLLVGVATNSGDIVVLSAPTGA
jgi:hypothetical protein